MKKWLFIIFTFCSFVCYPQTWTIRDDENSRDIEYTFITKEQFQRLLKQYEADNACCLLSYIDVLEKDKNEKIISGKKPELNGFYYLLAKVKPQLDKLTERERAYLNLLSITNKLIYGNSETGEMSLFFISIYGIFLPGVVSINSEEYSKKYNQFLGFVNGE